MSSIDCWYVLGVQSGFEADVAFYLSSIGLPIALPLKDGFTRPRKKRNPVRVKIPVFRGLVFVKTNPNRFSQMLGYRYILFMYKSRSRVPLIIPEEDIEELRRLEKEQFWTLGSTVLDDHSPAITIGSDYKILLGAFTGLMGQCIKVLGSTKAVVLVEGFKVEVPIQDLELVG